jgi:acetyl esterase/lipase
VSYDEGLNIIRSFLQHVAYHSVEDVQAFTAQKIPTPHWVKINEETIPNKYLADAAESINAQLGDRGIVRVGGKTWWQWRGPMGDLKAEWIEMKGDYRARRRTGASGKRVMLYVHGGAYFFGSIDTHRYQMQRHARKLKARVFARYV